MEWRDLKGVVGKAAPIIGTLLGGPLGAAAGGLVASVLEVENEPEAVKNAIEADPNLLLRVREAEIEQRSELQQLMIAAETTQLQETNETMRAELASGDKFKSYWRPLFGYVTAISWGAMMFAVSWKIVFGDATATITAVAETFPLWGVALAVLGINVVKRSDDKAVMVSGQSQVGVLGALASRIRSGPVAGDAETPERPARRGRAALPDIGRITARPAKGRAKGRGRAKASKGREANA